MDQQIRLDEAVPFMLWLAQQFETDSYQAVTILLGLGRTRVLELLQQFRKLSEPTQLELPFDE